MSNLQVQEVFFKWLESEGDLDDFIRWIEYEIVECELENGKRLTTDKNGKIIRKNAIREDDSTSKN